MSIHVGNAVEASGNYRGWFVGHFVGAPGDLTRSESLEVKWDGTAPGRRVWNGHTAATPSVSRF